MVGIRIYLNNSDTSTKADNRLYFHRTVRQLNDLFDYLLTHKFRCVYESCIVSRYDGAATNVSAHSDRDNDLNIILI